MGFTVFGSSASSGVAQAESDATNFRVWPSVASTRLLVTLDESARATAFDLVDAIGRRVMTRPLFLGNRSFELSVADLASGLYVCRLTTESGVRETKIIVRH
jgi:hypothetical protein